MPSRVRRKFPTGAPKTPAERACYMIGLRCREADDMPNVDSEHWPEWALVELGKVALTSASYLGWRHVWWWIDRGRKERPPGTVLIHWGKGYDDEPTG